MMDGHPVCRSLRRSLPMFFLLSSLVLTIPSLHAAISTRSCGFGLSTVGQAGLVHPQETMGGLGVSLSYAPFSLAWLEPSLQSEVTAGVTETGFSFRSVRVGLNFDIFRTLHHPFQVMTANPSMWSIALAAGAQFEFDRINDAPKLYLSCTLVKLKDKDFWYEWCAPYMTLDFSDGRTVIDSWGLVLFRFTFLFV